jgi:ribose 5-phosphate isomerase B
VRHVKPDDRGKRVAMLIAIASDHAGYRYKERIKIWLKEAGHEVEDFGTTSAESCDYPLFIRPAAEAVAQGLCARAVVLGGSGNGEAIVANRVRGVRCAYVFNAESARLGREHNDANAIAIGERLVPIDTALDCVRIFLDTPFAGGRHARRIAMIDAG